MSKRNMKIGYERTYQLYSYQKHCQKSNVLVLGLGGGFTGADCIVLLKK